MPVLERRGEISLDRVTVRVRRRRCRCEVGDDAVIAATHEAAVGLVEVAKERRVEERRVARCEVRSAHHARPAPAAALRCW